jgi:hypothetical protein
MLSFCKEYVSWRGYNILVRGTAKYRMGCRHKLNEEYRYFWAYSSNQNASANIFYYIRHIETGGVSSVNVYYTSYRTASLSFLVYYSSEFFF